MARPDYMVITENPFGKGSLTTNGVQYSTEVTGITHAAFTAAETVTIHQPQFTGYILEQTSFSLTGATKSSSTTKDVTYKFQASDDGTNWQDLNSVGTQSADASSYADFTYSGTFGLTTNFLGKEKTFQLRMVAKAEDSGETASAKVKASSWVKRQYRAFGVA